MSSTAARHRRLDPLTDSNEQRLFGGEANGLYGGDYSTGGRGFPNLDGDADDAPEWVAWYHYNPERAEYAKAMLTYVKTSDGVHHFVDSYSGEQYSIPTKAEWDRYQGEDEVLERSHGARPKIWMTIIKVYLALCVLAFFVGVGLASNSERAATGMPDNVIHVALLLLVLGTPMLFLLRQISRPNPRSLPEHRMFYSLAEWTEIKAAEKRARMRNVALFAGFMGAMWLHHRHSDDDDD